MTNLELAEQAKKIASLPTLYVENCFGSRLNNINKNRFTHNHIFNAKEERRQIIMNAPSSSFGFGNAGFVKALCWGWRDGESGYSVNQIPDIASDLLIKRCSDISDDMNNILIGEMIWADSLHLGIYLGDGKVAYSDHIGSDGVQITDIKDNNLRNWFKHGKLPGIKYD